MAKFYIIKFSGLNRLASLFFILFAMLFSRNIQAAANVAGTGNNSLCLNVSTAIGNITITEGAAGDFCPGTNFTYIIVIPPGFEFDPGAAVSAGGTGDLTNVSVLGVTTTKIFIQYTAATTSSNGDVLTISGIKVIAKSLGSGDIV